MTGDKNNFMEPTQGEDSNKRKPGYYWVRFKDGDWTLGLWFFGLYWILHGTDKNYPDSYFMEINENIVATDQKPQPSEVKGGVWVKASTLPEIIDRRVTPKYVRYMKKRWQGEPYEAKAVAYYFPEHFKTVEWEDWDDYNEQDFPYTENDPDKGCVWLRPGWYVSIDCQKCEEHWSEPIEVTEWYNESLLPSQPDEAEYEREIMIRAFDKVSKLFKMREWIMEGRGSYRYDDDRYKEEVRYLYDEFDQVKKDTWKEIKSKTYEYRNKIIEEYKKESSADAEKEACEFAEWIGINNWQADYYMGSELILWSSNKKIPEEISTEQLRNQYLKTKQ